LDEVKDNLVQWNKLKGISRSKHVGHLNQANHNHNAHSAGIGVDDGDLHGITTADAITRLQKLANVAHFEQK